MHAPRVETIGIETAHDHTTVFNLARYCFGENGTGKSCIVLPARDINGHGYQELYPAQWNKYVYADGVWYTKMETGNVLAMPTADCPVVVGWQPRTMRIALAHCGRPALTPVSATKFQNVLSAMMRVFACQRSHAVEDVLFTVTPCVSQRHFSHHFHDEARSLIDPFRSWHKKYPKYGTISDDGQDSLSLRGVIRLQLEQRYLVPPTHITVNNTCTYDHDALVSRRKNETGTNLTLVLY
jgi:copper oxidase (laccase) domain-containing protein